MPTAQRLRLYHKLQIAAHLLQTEADRAVQQAAGITAAQSAVLALVARARGEATQRAVARRFGVFGIPCFVLFRGGRRLGKMSDFRSDAFWLDVVREQVSVA